MPPPYVITNVAIDEDPDVHLTTNIVGAEPREVRIGQRVQVTFEQADDVWIPLFEPSDEDDVDGLVAAPERPTPRPPVRDDRFEHHSVISGIGRSDIGRRLMRDPLSLAVDACLAAIADAGLTPDDIDGLSTYPGAAPMGMSDVLFPNFMLLVWAPGWYLTYHYWPTAHDRHIFEGTLYFAPPRNATERIRQELAGVTFKEYALQDPNTLEATQRMIESRSVNEFPLCDQEVLLRHLHHSARQYVDAHLAGAMGYLDGFDLDALPEDATRLLWLCYSLVNATFPVEVWRQARVPDSGAASMDVVIEPAV